jgi:hypothetical protein
MLFNSGHQALKTLKLSKGQETNLWIHKNYTINDIVELSYKPGLEKITVRNDAGGHTIIVSDNKSQFGHDLSEIIDYRIFTNKDEAEKSWLFLLDGIRRQFKKIMKSQGFKSRKKYPEKYI